MNGKYLAKRLAQVVVSIYVVLTLTFVLIQYLPGDARDFVQAITAGQSGVGQAYIRSVGLEGEASKGILGKYLSYMSSVLHGDLGMSVWRQEPVADIIVRALPWTVLVAAVGLALTYALGISLGAVMAYREGSRFDAVVSTLGTFLNSIPYYVAGIVMLWILGFHLQWFPTSGRKPQGVAPGFTPEFVFGVLHHAALPILSIVVTAFGFRALSMRGNSIQVLGEEYVRVADLRGLADNRIAMQYVGRNAVLPMYTGLILAVGFVLGNSVILERVFQYQGIGFYLYQALGARDYPLLMGTFLVITTTVIVGLFIADITYGFIDPRATSGEGNESSTGSRLPLRARLVAWLNALRGLPARLRGDEGEGRVANGGLATAGGATAGDESLFGTTSDVTLSRRERYKRVFDEYVRAPMRIIWHDARTRLGAAIIAFYLLMATVGVWLVPAPEPGQGTGLMGAFQTMAHPLGTDIIGRDILSLIVYSTTPILKMILAGGVFATTMGTLVGLLAGYSGGLVDRTLMGLTDIAIAIPGIPLVMVLAVIFAPEDPFLVGLLLTVNAWGGIARQIRSQVLTIADQSYVEASGIMSLGLGTILLKDILPNIAPFVLVRAVQAARYVIFAAVGLYYLGVLPFATVNWGVMIQRAFENGALLSLDLAHWLLAPMLAIVVLTYGLILFAQGMDQIFNPRVRARHAETLETDSDGVEQSTGPGTIAGGD